uniref:oxygenase MpaB family protein n=1 Tax=Nocardia donostiensis TaxID=1538463 RepID=UPI0009D9BEC0|nr:oxygenase MpaB family protein [Nocardia donostiensis]
MTAHAPVPTGSPQPRPDFAVEDYIDGMASFLGGTANVIMQLGLRPVAYGVLESEVDSGKVMVHPLKRLRTTLTYLAVAMMGTDSERLAYRAAVNGSHRPIRTKPTSPVKYNAFDPQLQLWVAACLYWGFTDMLEKLRGQSMDEATADAFYQHSARLGTTLQVRPEMWPADRAAFAEYFATNLAATRIDPVVRDYFNDLIDLMMLPLPIRLVFGRFHRFVVTGVLPQHMRDQMGMNWNERDQRRFDQLMRRLGAVVTRLPKPLRMFPLNFYLWDLRRRLRTGKPLV